MNKLVSDWLHAGAATVAMFVVVWALMPGSPVLSIGWRSNEVEAAQVSAAERSAPAQGDTANMPNILDSPSLTQWAVKEGGAFVVILVILFFYRRDWKTATEYWKAQNTVTTQLCIDATKAQTDCAAALRENAVVTHQVKRVFERQFPERRGGTD